MALAKSTPKLTSKFMIHSSALPFSRKRKLFLPCCNNTSQDGSTILDTVHIAGKTVYIGGEEFDTANYSCRSLAVLHITTRSLESGMKKPPGIELNLD